MSCRLANLRGQRAAKSWKKNPSFAGDNASDDAIADYRANVMKRWLADEQGLEPRLRCMVCRSSQRDRGSGLESIRTADCPRRIGFRAEPQHSKVSWPRHRYLHAALKRAFGVRS